MESIQNCASLSYEYCNAVINIMVFTYKPKLVTKKIPRKEGRH